MGWFNHQLENICLSTFGHFLEASGVTLGRPKPKIRMTPHWRDLARWGDLGGQRMVQGLWKWCFYYGFMWDDFTTLYSFCSKIMQWKVVILRETTRLLRTPLSEYMNLYKLSTTKNCWGEDFPLPLEVNHHLKNGGSFWMMINPY